MILAHHFTTGIQVGLLRCTLSFSS